MDQKQLIFVIGSPRSGSTMLQRMLGSHPAIYTHPEPHLLTPLNYLGYYNNVASAPYDHINAAQAVRELVQELPRGEEDYLDALRAYASTIYERILKPTGKEFFLDKTPAYGLVLPFVAKLYPHARYVVLTRHPMAIFHSVAHSFFGGDYQEAHGRDSIVPKYVAGIGEFIREASVKMVQTRYEDLVSSPEEEVRKILRALDLPYDASCVNYGSKTHITKSFGDPMTVHKHDRPVTDSKTKWAADLATRPDALQLARNVAAQLSAEDLHAWGFESEHLFADLSEAAPTRTGTKLFNTYRMKKHLLQSLRSRAQDDSGLERTVKKIRYYCDLVLKT